MKLSPTLRVRQGAIAAWRQCPKTQWRHVATATFCRYGAALSQPKSATR